MESETPFIVLPSSIPSSGIENRGAHQGSGPSTAASAKTVNRKEERNIARAPARYPQRPASGRAWRIFTSRAATPSMNSAISPTITGWLVPSTNRSTSPSSSNCADPRAASQRSWRETPSPAIRFASASSTTAAAAATRSQ